MNHNTSAPKNIRFPTCVVTRYGSKYSKYKIYKEHLWSHTPFISTVQTLPPSLQEGPSKESPSHPWVRHPGRSDSTCNCGHLRGCGVSFPSWDGSGGSNFPSWQILQIFRKSNELILILINCKAFPCFFQSFESNHDFKKIARPACGADPAGCPEGWAGCGAGVAGPGTSAASKTWFSPSISTSNCSPDWASSLRDSGILSNRILIFDVRPVWWISNSSSWRNIPSCRLGPHLRRGCKTSSSEQSNSNPLWQNSQPMCIITIWAFSPCGWRKPMHFSGMHFPVMTRSQKWPSATVAPPSSKVTVSSFSQPAGVDLQTVSAPAHAGTWTWLKSQQMSSISPKKSSRLLYIDHVPKPKPIL